VNYPEIVYVPAQAYMETSSMLARATESELLDKLQSSIVKERVLMFLVTEVGGGRRGPRTD
jgi:hypothetical protein